MQPIQALGELTDLRLNLRQPGLSFAGLLVSCPDGLGKGQAHKALRILVSARDNTSAAHSITIQSDRIQAMGPCNLLAELHAATDNNLREDLLNSWLGPLR